MKKSEAIKAIREVADRCAHVSCATAFNDAGERVGLKDKLNMAAVALGWAKYVLEGDPDVPADPDEAMEWLCRAYLSVFKGGEGDE